MSLPPLLERPSVGEMAPRFALSSLNGETVDVFPRRTHDVQRQPLRALRTDAG